MTIPEFLEALKEISGQFEWTKEFFLRGFSSTNPNCCPITAVLCVRDGKSYIPVHLARELGMDRLGLSSKDAFEIIAGSDRVEHPLHSVLREAVTTKGKGNEKDN